MKNSPLHEECKKLSPVRNSSIFTLITVDIPIYPPLLIKFKDLLKGQYFDNIDLLVHSGGGDINTSYQIAELLRNHCKTLTVIVPLYAKSSATLLAIAADEIIMGELSELGPLDTQIAERKKGSTKYSSALNPFKSLEQLQSFSLETLDVTTKLVLSRANISVEDAIGHAIKFASSIAAPLFGKLDVEKLGEYSRALSVGKEYGNRLLSRYTKINNQEKVLELLVRGYPSHDYIIDYRELKELGFNVRYPNEQESPIIDSISNILITLDQTEIFCFHNEVSNNDNNQTRSRKGKENAKR